MRKAYLGNLQIDDKAYLGEDLLAFGWRGPFEIEYLVVGGGGAGGNSNDAGAGGGGAGGYLSDTIVLDPFRTIVVKVGTGGGATDLSFAGENGQSSSFDNISALGGGGGGMIDIGGTVRNGRAGGSGGGGAKFSSFTAIAGAGTTGQGFKGGDGTAGTGGAGGGGAISEGEDYDGTTNFGQGGNGIQSSINGTATWYSVGGPGNDVSPLSSWGDIGYGGRGRTNTTSQTAGGNGIVVIKYLRPQKALGGTVTFDGNYVVHEFRTPGTYTLTT
jgi:hypothetical protein